MKVVWTKHAEDRQREWQKKLEITRQEVENMISRPEQIVPGDQNTLHWLVNQEEVTVC